VAAAAHDDLALVALLRSPAVGLSDQALLTVTRLRQRGTPLVRLLVDGEALESCGLHPEDLTRVRRGARLVQRLRGLRGRCSTRELLDVGLEESGLLEGSLLRGTDVRGFANLQKLLEVVESLEREGASGPGEVAAILKDLRLSGARESEANVSTPDEDAVAVLTVHASKGLEWPLVVVADMGRKRPPAGDPILWSAETGIVPNLRDPELPREAITPGSLRRLWDEQKERGREESKRLLYVAMTRARDHLILAGGQNFSRHAPGDWLLWAREALAPVQVAPVEEREPDPACGGEAALQRSHGGVAVRVLEAADDQDGAPVQGPCGPAVGARPLLSEAQRIQLSRAIKPTPLAVEEDRRLAAAALVERARAATLPAVDQGASLYTVSEVLTWDACPRRALFEHLLGDDAPLAEGDWDLRGRGSGRVPPNVLGTLAHELLASAQPSTPARAVRRLRQLLLPRVFPEKTLRGAAKRALQLASGFARTELGRRAAASAEVLREYPFLVSLAAGQGAEPILLRGTIDLAFREDDGWVLADYKAGEVTALQVSSRIGPHALQLRLYALAMASLGYELHEGVITYLAADVECRVRLDPQSLSATRDRLAEFAAARRELDLPPRPGASCRFCPHLRGCPAGQEAIPGATRTPALAHRVPAGSVAPPTGV
jgi:ATP-dependent helicase/nuclease subunit A